MKTFSARETLWLQELDGLELASFWSRAFALLIDTLLIGVLLSATLSIIATLYVRTHPGSSIHINLNEAEQKLDQLDDATAAHPFAAQPHQELLDEASKLFTDILVPILYFGLFLWKTNGRTPGKRLLRIRVISLVHTHITFWHAVERALGYGAALLEGGFGFIQFFIHPYHRCAQDRLAETIVVTERAYQQKFPSFLPTPPESETLPQ